MGNFKDLTGLKFGRLTVISIADKLNGTKHIRWNVKCDCGTIKTVRGDFLNAKIESEKSCGCAPVISKYTHGKSNTKTYKTWVDMLRRVNDENYVEYHRYGGRGIIVCDSWLKFEGFYRDMGDRPEGLSLDRINNDGNYCKENCRWATNIEQHNNTSRNKYITYNSETYTIKEWSIKLNINYRTLYNRLFARKWSVENSFNVPVNEIHNNKRKKYLPWVSSC